MKQIIEIIPNYSEGKQEAVMKEILAPFQRPEITLCKLEMDASYHRSVVSVIGELDAVLDAAIASLQIASRLIDLRSHKGEHKRMGACDVLPLLPIHNITTEELIAISEEFGRRIAEETKIPVYLYALSAKREQCTNLPDIRKGEFEGLQEKMQDPYWHPDFGSPDIHPTAGAIAVGVRKPLLAYNVDVTCSDLAQVKEIAKAMRFSSGGYRFIQAGAVQLEDRYQVSMNVTDYTKTALYRAFEAVAMEAKRYDAVASGSEIIGLIPKDALLDTLAYYLKKPDKNSLQNLSLDEIVELAVHHLKLYGFTKEKVVEYYVAADSV